MKPLLITCLSILAVLMISSCSSKSAEKQEQTTSKSLVLYYSQNGATQTVAEQIASALGADIEEIKLKEPYDGTYEETIQRCLSESQEGLVPEVKPLNVDLSQYEVVFLGYPIWFGTYATPIKGLVKDYDFDGVKVVPFCTFGSGGLEASAADLKEALPKAHIEEGYGVRNARISDMPDEIAYFLIANGYIDGEVYQLPDFSEFQDVTDNDIEIFNQACGDYQFPLGTPVKVAQRPVPNGTEYMYQALSKGPNGDANSTIYVLVKDDVKPVFTKVVR